jgi:hypothetical protein
MGKGGPDVQPPTFRTLYTDNVPAEIAFESCTPEQSGIIEAECASERPEDVCPYDTYVPLAS